MASTVAKCLLCVLQMSQFQSKQQATPAAGSSNQKVATAASASATAVAVAVAASSVAELMTGYPQDAKTGKSA